MPPPPVVPQQIQHNPQSAMVSSIFLFWSDETSINFFVFVFVDSDIKGAPGGVENGSVNVAGSRGSSTLATGALRCRPRLRKLWKHCFGFRACSCWSSPYDATAATACCYESSWSSIPGRNTSTSDRPGFWAALNGPHHGQAHGQPGASQQSGTNRPSPPSWYSPNDHIAERRKMVCIFYERSLQTLII